MLYLQFYSFLPNWNNLAIDRPFQFFAKSSATAIEKITFAKWSQDFGKIANIMISASGKCSYGTQKSRIVWLMFYEKHEDLKMVPTSKYCGRLSLKIWGAHFILIAKAMIMAHLLYASFLGVNTLSKLKPKNKLRKQTKFESFFRINTISKP